MGLIIKLSIRNLLRQKRRNTLLGIAIAFGMMILVLANSFSRGLSDMIFNKFLIHAFGHINITVIINGNTQGSVNWDKDRFINIIKDKLSNVRQVNQAIGGFTRVTGNGKSDMMVLAGVPMDELLSGFKDMVREGDIYGLTNINIENPVVISDAYAKELNVKTGDYLKVRLLTVTGQVQSARLTVIALLKSSNSFLGMVMYIPVDILKRIFGYKLQESGRLQIVLNRLDNPELALSEADKLHRELEPKPAAYYGNVVKRGLSSEATTLAYFTNTNLINILKNNIKFISGKLESSVNSNNIMISMPLAYKLNAKTGDVITSLYQNKFDNIVTSNSYKIAAIFDPANTFAKYTILISENNFYSGYYRNLPVPIAGYKNAFLPGKNSAVYPVLATEWRLLKRTSTLKDYNKKMRSVKREKWEGAYVDVTTMYELANFILQLEAALNIISVIAVLILFFIILIGVINTLRMSILERTREIGTARAIGMQRRDVRNMFIMEYFFLALFSCTAGSFAALGIMGIISFINIETDSMLSIFLLNKHIHFVPNIPSIIFFLLFIILTAAATAYIPSGKASKLSAAEAFRHYE